MAQLGAKMIVPPFAGVTLVEFRDRIELTPVYWVREFVGLGKHSADDVGPQPGDDLHPLYNAVMGGKPIWVIATWRWYESGHEEAIRLVYLDPEATEAEAHKELEQVVRFENLSRHDLEELSKCFQATDEDLAYIENRFPDTRQGPPVSGSIEEKDLYQARLKVLAGMQPKTVELIRRADETTDPTARAKIEREAVHAFFADLAHHWTEDFVREWQRTNPIGTEWMCEFARVLAEPERDIDPINYELALNWLRRKYNLMTAEELSDAVLVATGQRVSPATLKKRRERLGLTTTRPPGPRPNSER